MTSMSDRLTEFLLARIAEDEAVAERLRRKSLGDPWGLAINVTIPETLQWQPRGVTTNDARRVEFSPARVLAECEAKRRIVERHYTSDDVWETGTCGYCGSYFPCADLRDLAAVYADHPDYREEWKP